MTTRAELETEAAELYPNAPGRMFNGEPFPRFEQQAHIQAKTISAEQVEKAAKEVWRHQVGADTSGFYKHAYAHTVTKCMDTARAAFRAAGFYVEGEE